MLDFYLTRYTASRETQNVELRLISEAHLVAYGLADAPRAGLKRLAGEAGDRAQARVTVIAHSGVVLADSQHDPETMKNHASRPEVREALQGRTGASVRHSVTLNRDLCYVALPFTYQGRRGFVLRLAVPLTEVSQAVSAVRWRIVYASAIAAVLALLLAYFFSLRIGRRIGRIKTFAESLLSNEPASPLPEAGDELGALSRALNRMGRQLRRYVDIRRDFVANVSHELRTPLAAILGYAETLLDGAMEDAETSRKFLETIRAHAIRLNNISADLLTLSELDAGVSLTPRSAFSLKETIAAAVRTVEPEARLRSVRLICGAIDDIEIHGHKLRLEQALVNLLDNAVKFNHPGGEVRIEVLRTPDGQARVKIADTGSGIPSQDLGRIFERFYRVDRARSRQVGGTGLGLAIVKHAVELMNGSIEVTSELGSGSTFTLSIPVEVPEHSPRAH